MREVATGDPRERSPCGREPLGKSEDARLATTFNTLTGSDRALSREVSQKERLSSWPVADRDRARNRNR
jgi:hypothetical protein